MPFLQELRWIKSQGETADECKTVLICTDSMSLAKSLENDHWKDADPWLKEIKNLPHTIHHKVILLWIPSHVDIPGNEIADELAGRGAAMN